jgi:hypothetical protein
LHVELINEFNILVNVTVSGVKKKKFNIAPFPVGSDAFV